MIAKSEMSGMKMVPISWTEMQCPKTYNKENRKIAKVIPEDLNESLWAMNSIIQKQCIILRTSWKREKVKIIDLSKQVNKTVK